MALYHFHVDQVKRSEGCSAVASAAYRAGEKLHNLWDGETHDYTKKGGVVFTEIMLPPNAPEHFSDRSTLWNDLEQFEKRGDAQLAYSFDIAMQNEFTLEENIEFARQFVREQFLSAGMIVDFAFHLPGKDENDIPNPHFHVLVPIRPLNEEPGEQSSIEFTIWMKTVSALKKKMANGILLRCLQPIGADRKPCRNGVKNGRSLSTANLKKKDWIAELIIALM